MYEGPLEEERDDDPEGRDLEGVCIYCDKEGADIHWWCKFRHSACYHNDCLMMDSDPVDE